MPVEDCKCGKCIDRCKSGLWLYGAYGSVPVERRLGRVTLAITLYFLVVPKLKAFVFLVTLPSLYVVSLVMCS
jgi:hypothetical protein